jgi:hypothetical protein
MSPMIHGHLTSGWSSGDHHRAQPLCSLTMSAQTIKTIGGVCQLAGVVLVVVNLVAIHEYRGDLTRMRAAIIQRLRRVLHRRGRTVALAGTAHASARASGTASGIGVQLWPPTSPTASVEERLAALESLPDLIATQLERERRAQADARRELAEQLRREIQAEMRRLTDAIATAQQRHEHLEELTTGSTQLGWVGVLLLLAGVGFTTWPDGMAAWPNWLSASFIALLALAVGALLSYRANESNGHA